MNNHPHTKHIVSRRVLTAKDFIVSNLSDAISLTLAWLSFLNRCSYCSMVKFSFNFNRRARGITSRTCVWLAASLAYHEGSLCPRVHYMWLQFISHSKCDDCAQISQTQWLIECSLCLIVDCQNLKFVFFSFFKIFIHPFQLLRVFSNLVYDQKKEQNYI